MTETGTTGAPTYADAGVAPAAAPLAGLLHWVRRSMALRSGIGAAALDVGFYANVISLGGNLGLAISTDSVGTKILVAEAMRRYDTIGIDCVAMNANDIVCVGAEPLAMVDYIAVQEARPDVLEAIGRGLYEGARQAGITIPGGELAQLREIVAGVREGEGIDLVGTCVGTVPLDQILVGRDAQPGDAVVGLASSGIHSNGLTLARNVFFQRAGWTLERHVPEFGRALGEELLEPTRIYVPEALAMLRERLPIRAFVHVTGDGLLNLARIDAPVGFEIDTLPPIPPVFTLLQQLGGITDEEMFRAYNMGVGFCVIVPDRAVETVAAIAARRSITATRLGHLVADPQKRVWLRPKGLVGQGEEFRRE
jgi:phosphoribosylformylglycinamidine cyclo-ligase